MRFQMVLEMFYDAFKNILEQVLSILNRLRIRFQILKNDKRGFFFIWGQITQKLYLIKKKTT